MVPGKTVLFVGDGMADEPVPELDGRTPLQAAKTPAMDSIARDGASGTLLTLPEGFATGSEVANMSLLGCDLATEYGGRGPLEAAGRGIILGPGDIAFRLNLTTVEDGILRDFSGGRVAGERAAALIDALNKHFGSDDVHFFPGISYRNLLVLSGPSYSHDVATEKPDDNHGEPVEEHLPRPRSPKAQATVEWLVRLIREAAPVLEACEANREAARNGRPVTNGVWPWSGGRAGTIRTLQERYGITGAVIAAVDVIAGLGRCLGMDVIPVEGVTGYVDTNYEGKAQAAMDALKDHDFVFVHVEGIDEVSHEQDLAGKLQAIEDFDARLVGPVLDAAGAVNAAVLPDHPVPLAIGRHTRTPVPVAVRREGLTPDTVDRFDEIACATGSLGAMVNGDLMRILLG